MYRLSLAILGDEADARDATQETFVAAWRRIASLRDPDRFEAWLQRIAVNAARMTAPRPAATASSARSRADERGRRGSDETAWPVRHRTLERLGAALERLSADQRAILALHHLEGRRPR